MDRNDKIKIIAFGCYASLSARRAWIEIAKLPAQCGWEATSLSARRAWIEIVITAMTSQISVVALRKESVDRNTNLLLVSLFDLCRSPQGERG